MPIKSPTLSFYELILKKEDALKLLNEQPNASQAVLIFEANDSDNLIFSATLFLKNKDGSYGNSIELTQHSNVKLTFNAPLKLANNNIPLVNFINAFREGDLLLIPQIDLTSRFVFYKIDHLNKVIKTSMLSIKDTLLRDTTNPSPPYM